MVDLVDSADAQLDTDFAILSVAQTRIYDAPETSFAASQPGMIRMTCGNKFARVHVRVERWNGRPPFVEGWEDVDEVPFEEVPGAGLIAMSGFDAEEGILDLSGFGSGRVQICARGRHRYDYGSAIGEGLAPEEWLVRFYPSVLPPDPMAGEPRRIAGGAPHRNADLTPWRSALLGLHHSGWTDVMVGSKPFELIRGGLWRVGAPVSRSELASYAARGMPPWQFGGADSEATAIVPRAWPGGVADPLAAAAGRSAVTTIGDAIDAMIELGLVLVARRGEHELLVPNPSPEPAWESLVMNADELRSIRGRALAHAYGSTANDIANAAAWTGTAGLTSTPRAMAIRWSTTVAEVTGALRLLGGSGRVACAGLGYDSELDPDDLLRLTAARDSRPV